MRRPKIARRSTGRGIIRGMVSITARPAEAENRKVPGHWEGDLVTGTRPSTVATLVERTSRCTAIVALPDGSQGEGNRSAEQTGSRTAGQHDKLSGSRRRDRRPTGRRCVPKCR